MWIHGFKPVDDAFAVQEHEGGGDLRRVEPRPGLLELPGLLDVEHEIASVHKLHHKEEPVLWEEAKKGTASVCVCVCAHKARRPHRGPRVINQPKKP